MERLPSGSFALTAVIAILALVVGTEEVFSQYRPEVPSTSSLIDPRLEKIAVAKVGPLTISGMEFKLSYELGPSFTKREKDSKKRYLNFMVFEKLLSLDAKDRGLDKWADVKRQLAELEGDLATEELYKDDVLKRVRIPNRQLAASIAQERIHARVRWLFFGSAQEVDSAERELKSGASFDSLYDRQLRSGFKSEDRSIETTKFKLRMQNPMFAALADTMAVRTVSLPIHGPDGWYIVNLSNMWINPVVTQTNEMKMEEEVRRALTQHIADSLSDKYVQALIAGRHPTILREQFNALQAHLGKRYLDRQKFEEWKLQDRKGAKELSDVSNLDSIESQTLVELKENNLTVRNFLEWFRMREPYVRLTLSSSQVFFQSVEELVWRMVRDRLLTRRAFERGYQNRATVRRQTRWWKEKILYSGNKQRIADTITDSLPALRKYYEDNSRDFRDDSGKVKPFDSARQDVWRQYYSYELVKRLLHEILRLKQKYRVTIEDSALNNIQVADENDPRTIDVYAVKKGGIYPHTAFPSIDYDWQSWN